MKKKTLIVLNPLIPKILGENGYKELIQILENKGYLVDDSRRGLIRVKNLYRQHLPVYSLKPVIDTRCPKVVEFIKKEHCRLAEGHLAPIFPILIMGALLAHKKATRNISPCIDLVIISPCEAMKIHEKRVDIEDWNDCMIFTWREFKILEDINLPETKLEVSPIMNFFQDLSKDGRRVYEANGEEAVRKLLSNIPKDTELLELLWGCGGCAAGDGL